MTPAGPFDVAFVAPAAAPLVAQMTDPTAEEVVMGGAETQVLLLARTLARAGWRVCVVVRAHPGIPETLDGVVFATIPDRSLTWRPVRGMASVAALIRTLIRLDAQVFVQRTASIDTGLVGAVAKVRRRRFVFSSSSTASFNYRRIEPRRIRRVLYRIGIRLADALVVQTKEQARLCSDCFGRDGIVVRSLAEPAPEPTAQPEYFLWAGRFEWIKDPVAFVDLARSLPDVEFRMVGRASGADGQALERTMERVSAELPNFQVHPPLRRPELLALIGRSVAVVSTSLFEGMPNVFLEAWARGVPALSLRHDPDGAITGEGLGGFADGSPDRLRELAEELWASPSDRAATGARCRNYVAREHAPDIAVERWAQVLAPGATGRGTPPAARAHRARDG